MCKLPEREANKIGDLEMLLGGQSQEPPVE